MPQLQPEGRAPGRFPTTQWSRVATAAGRDDGEAREALSMLCQAYWYPIYAFVRHRGFSPEQAQDRTQDFFAYVLERDLIAQGGPGPGPLPRLPAHRRAPGTWPAIATGRTRPSGAGAGRVSPSTPSTPSAATPSNPPTR